MNVYEETYLPDILNKISQGMLIPTMVCLIALLVATVFIIGQVFAEWLTERRHYKQNMPAIVNAISEAAPAELIGVIARSKLLRFQKEALLVVARNLGLPEEALFSLAQISITKAQQRYQRRLAWTDTIAKIAPLLGLMGTLIPLGPGIVALGQNQTEILSRALLTAFDATVVGLVCAIVALVVSKVRSGWYTECVSSLESLMGCVVETGQLAAQRGESLPCNYAGDPLKDCESMLGAASPESEAPSQPAQA